MPAAWDDPRIASGMKEQLRWRRVLLRSGKKPLGWKLAFGGPAALQRLRSNEPLVGFLMADALLQSGSNVSLAGWKKPAAEPEIAVCLGKDLPANADRKTTSEAIAGLGAAIELADVDHPSEDVEGTLVRNIYQRHLVLSGCDAAYAGGVPTGLRGRVTRNSKELANTSDFEGLTGELIHIVGHVATLVSHFDETLRAGQIIIAGSITPPIWVAPGETIGFHLQPLEAISLSFTEALPL
jgi:2-keto-4-pentenoate hydratase